MRIVKFTPYIKNNRPTEFKTLNGAVVTAAKKSALAGSVKENALLVNYHGESMFLFAKVREPLKPVLIWNVNVRK